MTPVSFDAATPLLLVHSEDVLLSPLQTARTLLQPPLQVLPLALPQLVSQLVPTSQTVPVSSLPMVPMVL